MMIGAAIYLFSAFFGITSQYVYVSILVLQCCVLYYWEFARVTPLMEIMVGAATYLFSAFLGIQVHYIHTLHLSHSLLLIYLFIILFLILPRSELILCICSSNLSFYTEIYHFLLGDCGEGRKKWYSQHWQKEVRIMFVILNICSINHVCLELLCSQTNGLIRCSYCMVVQKFLLFIHLHKMICHVQSGCTSIICWYPLRHLIYLSCLIERHILCISCRCTYEYCIYM